MGNVNTNKKAITEYRRTLRREGLPEEVVELYARARKAERVWRETGLVPEVEITDITPIRPPHPEPPNPIPPMPGKRWVAPPGYVKRPKTKTQ